MLRKKIAALSVIVLVIALAACFGGTAPEPTPEPTPYREIAERELDYAYEKFSPNTVVMEVNGQEIFWSEYFYWLMESKYNYESYFGPITDYSEMYDETMTIADVLADIAEDNLKSHIGLETGVREAEVELSEEDEATLNGIWESQVSYAGSEEELLVLMDSFFLSREYFTKLNEISLLYEVAFDHIYGVDGANLSDEDAMAYADANGYMQAQHILLKTIGDDQMPLYAATIAEKATLAQDLLVRLNNAEDKDAEFKAVRMEFDEDLGQSYYPDGYCFLSGRMVPEFETAVQSLENGGISAVVETLYGYHIIMRLPVTPDSIVSIDTYTGAPSTIRYNAAFEKYSAQVQSWIESAVVEYVGEFKELDLAQVFAKPSEE